MKCLNDAQVQAVVDNEATEDMRRHAASCPLCGERVSGQEALTTAILSAMNVPAGIPPGVRRLVGHALDEESGQGATRLRHGRTPAPRPWRAAAWSGGALAAATLIAVLFIAPMIKAPATVSAAEILARSADRLAQQATSGVEFLEYELVLEGVPREVMPDHIDGAYRVRQVIDHDAPGRYLAAAYDPAGQVVWGVTQDPASKRRAIATPGRACARCDSIAVAAEVWPAFSAASIHVCTKTSRCA